MPEPFTMFFVGKWLAAHAAHTAAAHTAAAHTAAAHTAAAHTAAAHARPLVWPPFSVSRLQRRLWEDSPSSTCISAWSMTYTTRSRRV